MHKGAQHTNATCLHDNRATESLLRCRDFVAQTQDAEETRVEKYSGYCRERESFDQRET